MDAHGRGADAVRLVDARGRTHLEQLYAHRQVPPPLAGDKHGSLAIVVRLGDVRGRAHLKQPLAH